MRRSLVLVLVAACTAPADSTRVLDLPGPRNEAFRAAADRHGVPEDLLVAIAYQQGRFEPAEQVDSGDDPSLADTPTDPLDPPATLDEDTPADDLGDMEVALSPDPSGDEDPVRSWGVMYLTDAQIDRAAALTGHDPDSLRSDIAANIDGAAALLADARSHTDLRSATLGLVGATDDAAQLTLDELDHALATGFDVTTEDGERIALTGSEQAPPPPPPVEAPDPESSTDDGTTDILAVAPGHYPHVQWIPSPNHSSRLGSHIRYVIIHDIEGRQATAVQIFKSAASQVSAHYVLRASDGHIVKMVRESQDAWHAGHGWFNRHSIGIEHEGFAFRKRGGGFYTDTQYQASARLVCAIVHHYNIPVDRKHIFGHMNVPANLSSHTVCSDARALTGACGGVDHHQDPGRYWNWKKYMHLIRTCVAAAG